MKRFFVTILSILYLASAIGATLEIHYCMGKSMGANFVHQDNDACRKCRMHKSKSKGCCKDEHKIFKTADHQQVKASFDLAHGSAAILPAKVYQVYHLLAYDHFQAPKAQANAPPDLWRSCPIYLQVRNIRV